jgi:hypothetical protein
MIKKFNQLFENNNHINIESLMEYMSNKYCIKGMLYLVQTTDYDPNYNIGDGNILTMIDEYERVINNYETDSLIKLVELLIKKGIDINALDINGRPTISITNNIQIQRLLLNADCDLNIIGDDDDGFDTLDINSDLKELVKRDYPEKYKKYLKKKKSKSFNL